MASTKTSDSVLLVRPEPMEGESLRAYLLALADANDKQLQPKLAVLEGHLAANKYFGIDKWDMADFMVASVTFTLNSMKYDLTKYPKFAAWLAASLDRPRAREAMKYRA